MGSLSGNPVGAALAIADAGFDLIRTGQNTRFQNKALAADAATRASQIQQAQAYREKQLDGERKRTLASQRARFGAMGMDSGTGSAQALLDGLHGQYDEEAALGRWRTDTALDDLYRTTAQRQQANLLNASQQRMQWLFSTAKRFLPSQRLVPGQEQ
jgi:hypothetical protein